MMIVTILVMARTMTRMPRMSDDFVMRHGPPQTPMRRKASAASEGATRALHARADSTLVLGLKHMGSFNALNLEAALFPAHGRSPPCVRGAVPWTSCSGTHACEIAAGRRASTPRCSQANSWVTVCFRPARVRTWLRTLEIQRPGIRSRIATASIAAAPPPATLPRTRVGRDMRSRS